MLPATNTYPIYEGNVIKKFVQTTKKTNYNQIQQNQETSFESNQVCYIHYDDYVLSKMDVRGYLEPAIRTWNQYKNLQDSLIIYRLVRAPTRRLWNVEAGRLPPGKAEEFLKHMMVKYKQNYNYNPEKGNVDSSKLFQALTDDYWFIKFKNIINNIIKGFSNELFFSRWYIFLNNKLYEISMFICCNCFIRNPI